MQPSYSRLLRLPGELRNRIYRYTLTSDRPLTFVESIRPEKDRLAFFIHGTFVEFNQSKYVCRQLYTETAGLELKYSPITFFGNSQLTRLPARLFNNFLSTCATSKVSWLSDIILCAYGTKYNFESAQNLLLVAEFCRLHPHVRVEYIDGQFNMHGAPDTFIDRGAYLAMAIRRTDPG